MRATCVRTLVGSLSLARTGGSLCATATQHQEENPFVCASRIQPNQPPIRPRPAILRSAHAHTSLQLVSNTATSYRFQRAQRRETGGLGDTDGAPPREKPPFLHVLSPSYHHVVRIRILRMFLSFIRAAPCTQRDAEQLRCGNVNLKSAIRAGSEVRGKGAYPEGGKGYCCCRLFFA